MQRLYRPAGVWFSKYNSIHGENKKPGANHSPGFSDLQQADGELCVSPDTLKVCREARESIRGEAGEEVKGGGGALEAPAHFLCQMFPCYTQHSNRRFKHLAGLTGETGRGWTFIFFLWCSIVPGTSIWWIWCTLHFLVINVTNNAIMYRNVYKYTRYTISIRLVYLRKWCKRKEI